MISKRFTGPVGKCKHCGNEKAGTCKFRKTYTLDDRAIEKCNGSTFRFDRPQLSMLGDYIGLFQEFYPERKRPKRRLPQQER